MKKRRVLSKTSLNPLVLISPSGDGREGEGRGKEGSLEMIRKQLESNAVTLVPLPTLPNNNRRRTR